MNIIFFGSSKYSAIVAKSIYDLFGLRTIITLPDRIGNRNKILKNPMKKFAEEYNIPVISVSKLIDSINQIASISPDFFVVCDYGKILSEEMLKIPKNGALNVHHSLLPKYRGPSPTSTTIINSETESGVTIIEMSKKMDAGDILSQENYRLEPDETNESLLIKLNIIGSKLIIRVLENYNKIVPIKQNENEATYTKMIKKENGYIDISAPKNKNELDCMIRAYYPWPGVHTKLEIKKGEIKIIKLLPNQMIQMEGKKPMNYKDFINGYSIGKEILEKLQLFS